MFSHVNNKNQPQMVDVSKKNETERMAHARGFVELPQCVMDHFSGNEIQSKKGPVFQTAIIAATMAVKNTSNIIPFCHSLLIESIKIDIEKIDKSLIQIDCRVKVFSKTGVEMEALTGVSVAALTIYDMCKALSHDIKIKDCYLVEKTGGKSEFR